MQPEAVADEAVNDNIDNLGANSDIQTEVVENAAKDPQQAALDQAATINNNIDPVGNEAVVDDDDGKSNFCRKIVMCKSSKLLQMKMRKTTLKMH